MRKIVSLFIIISSLIYLFYNFDISKIDWQLFDFFGVLFTFVLILFGQVLLSIRWQKMSGLDFKISFETMIVSSFLNMVLPAKLGEVSKIMYLKKFYNITVNKIISVLFVERFFDILMLGIISLLFFYFYFKNEVLQTSIIFIIIFIIFIIIIFKLSLFKELLKKIPFRFLRVYSQKIYLSIGKLLSSPLETLIWTLLLWLSYLLSNWIFYVYGIDFGLTLIQILEIFLFSSIALSISITPGGIATYEAVMVFVLAKYGVDKENALVAATLYHFLLYLVDFILFGLFLFFKDINYKDIVK